MSNVDAIQQRIIDILETEASIKQVKSSSLQNAASFPACIVGAETATYERVTSDMEQITRDYRIIVLAKAARQGLEQEAEAATYPFFPLMFDLFSNRPSLTLLGTDPLPNVIDSYLVQDSGFIVLTLANVPYAACDFLLRVVTGYDLEQGI